MLLKKYRAKVLKIAVFDNPLSSKVVDLGTNRMHVCNFLLVINSNLVPISSHIRDIADFLLKTATPPLFHPNFAGVALNQIVDFVAQRSEVPKLISRVITFELTPPIPIRPRTPTLHNRRTDGQTNDLL